MNSKYLIWNMNVMLKELNGISNHQYFYIQQHWILNQMSNVHDSNESTFLKTLFRTQ